ncbi:GAF domain-containing sensor histidine kinase [Sediminibacterium sp. TEGAF015]|uniref:GAF domain-containing sensor histidine kinase n=1 Tax=Sediminibacterium sp. TEGAF015 TaxID=575378 RepID=UPI0022093AD4|nr:GAF domain-containing sensor histidine kinase [Sediminibacterium sp. TEGAF015]BDQ12037.1 sensor histidine kinase [Sediminibacterium sp. TEGAF015]
MQPPIPHNEDERVWALTEFDIDYSDTSGLLKDLVELAAKIAGTKISLVNLIDTYTQWTVANFGLPLDQMKREDSVCQYTIVQDGGFEVKSLSTDERFKDKFYVVDDPNLEYYFGIPLATQDGHNLGALCVLDTTAKTLSPEKVELLKIVAKEVVNRLSTIKYIQNLKSKVVEVKENNKKVAHDIRGPLSGIIGLAQMVTEHGQSQKLDDILEIMKLIQRAGNSLLDLATEILNAEDQQARGIVKADDFTLKAFKDKLEKLYSPQAANKQIDLSFHIKVGQEEKPIPKNKLLQIAGNLITNAIKFTDQNGNIQVDLNIHSITGSGQSLEIVVADSGIGLHAEDIEAILKGTKASSSGTTGEKGYGFGLSLVKRLIDELHGTLDIQSEIGRGTKFIVTLPQ